MVVPGKPDERNLVALVREGPRRACRLSTSRSQAAFARTSDRGFLRARRTTDGARASAAWPAYGTDDQCNCHFNPRRSRTTATFGHFRAELGTCAFGSDKALSRTWAPKTVKKLRVAYAACRAGAAQARFANRKSGVEKIRR